ncbi:MAG: TraR/DksA C4-type zinc finger protein [Actinobacteria bacterium]|nr:TraR/DksA C4-type zinc finger protein [Actinomycetota bacterium]
MSETGFDSIADSAQAAAERDLRAAIAEALQTLPRGESDGVCRDCGGKIEKARLALLPGTSQCAACAQKRAKLVQLQAN